MPVEAKPLFRPDVLRSHLSGFQLPAVEAAKLAHWASEISSGRVDRLRPGGFEPAAKRFEVDSLTPRDGLSACRQLRVHVACFNAKQPSKVVPPLERETHSNLSVKLSTL